MIKIWKRLAGVLFAVSLLVSDVDCSGLVVRAEEAASEDGVKTVAEEGQTETGDTSGTEIRLTFSDSAIEETVSGSGYTISGTTLTISAAGTYRVTGSCTEGSIVIEKNLTGVTLILDDLALASSTTAPIVVKKSSSAVLQLENSSTLTDSEDASTEETNADFEGACVKVKSGSSLKITGDGTLYVHGNAKNGIKGAAESALTVNGGTIHADAENNGIAFDGSIVINDGTITVASGNDGIKAVPDETDTASAGTIQINGGTITVNADGDGIQAGTDLTIADGVFDIKTSDGYSSDSFDADTMSCKGLKASGNDSDTDTEDAANTITITGGTFVLNTADDAIHSDGYVIITGGTFTIYTGDDGVHADTSLTLGAESGYERDPEINIYASYEGLEAGNVYAYSGKYYVVASDDGMNAAGGSSNGSDPGSSGDHFNPGGGPGGSSSGNSSSGSTGDDYNIYIYGGKFYVNADGDGLDSNGSLYLYGGEVTVFGQAQGGDNSPLDSDGTILIDGATVFAAGTNPMNETPSSASQYYCESTTTRSSGTIINVTYNGSTVYSEELVKKVNYLLYSSPEVGSDCSFSTGTGVDACNSNSWRHNWDSGTVTQAATESSAGLLTYTCSDCGETERKTIPMLFSVSEEEDDGGEEDGEGETVIYTAAFAVDSHATVDIYYTQDYAEADETSVTTAIARNSDTGESDGTGDGQINFAIVVEEGYEVASVTVEGTYKNLKEISADGQVSVYRITKIGSDLTVTVTTTESTSSGDGGGEEETTAYTATFVTDAHTTVNIYYSQDYTAADETSVTMAIARSSVTGESDTTGDGQINFAIVVEEGYEVASVTVEGTYKNLKEISSADRISIYRITKIESDLTVTVTTAATDSGSEDDENSEGDILPEDMPADGVIPDGIWIAGVQDMTYTGKAIKQTFRVYDHNRLLTEKTDYTVTYKNNVKVADQDAAKAPTIIVRGKGNYASRDTVTFSILPVDISDGEANTIVADDLAVKYNGKVQNPVPVVTVNGKKLTNKKDFTVTYISEGTDAYKAVGSYYIQIEGTGNYKGTKIISLSITDASLMSGVKVSAIKAQAYTGEPVEPELTVKSGSYSLVRGTDYDVEYVNNTQVGTATAILTGKGDYAGVKRVTFKITGQSIGKATVTGLESVTYSGEAWEPELTLTMGNVTLEMADADGNGDYTVSYESNTAAGTARVIITGINGYTGTVRKTFKITAFDLTADQNAQVQVEEGISVAFAKGGATPKPVVTFNGVTLTEGTDYTLSYANNKSVGSADDANAPAVTVKGKGNFKGSRTVRFTITRQSLNELSVTAADRVFKNAVKNYGTRVTVTDLNGNKLASGTDYAKTLAYTYANDTSVSVKDGKTVTEGVVREAGDTVLDTDIIPAGTEIHVKLTATGDNYEGEITGTFRIIARDIGKARVKVDAQTYANGEAVEPGKDQITATWGSGKNAESIQTDDYEIVSYRNNTKKGTASVTIRGLGDYGGTKTVKFKIKAKSFRILSLLDLLSL